MIKKLLKQSVDQRKSQRDRDLEQKLLRREAKIGGKIFGPTKKGERREFFCLDEHTWVWYEEWIDATGQPQSRTTRYEVQPERIIKYRDGQYGPVSDEELRNLYQAAQLYQQNVYRELYPFALQAA